MVNHRVIRLGRPTYVPVEPSQITLQEQALANNVRSLYCICYREFTGRAEYGTKPMPQWDGDPEGISGRRTSNVWIKIARKIAQCQADPYIYMRAQFYSTRLATPPAPNTLFNDAAVERYHHFHQNAKETITRSVESDDNQVMIHLLPFTVNLKWSFEQAMDYVLRDSSLGISPLVRFCHAVARKLDGAAQLWRDRALLQYLFQIAAYDDVLKDRIPPEFRTEAEACRTQVVNRE